MDKKVNIFKKVFFCLHFLSDNLKGNSMYVTILFCESILTILKKNQKNYVEKFFKKINFPSFFDKTLIGSLCQSLYQITELSVFEKCLKCLWPKNRPKIFRKIPVSQVKKVQNLIFNKLHLPCKWAGS